MSVTRQQLKSIVKECLVEILSEGMGDSTSSSINEVSKKNASKNNSMYNNSTILEKNDSKIKTKLQSSAIKQAIKREAGGNNIMAEIFADTAEKTLPAMLENDRTKMLQSPHGGIAERVVASQEPKDLFGEEIAAKWASLAFTGISKK